MRSYKGQFLYAAKTGLAQKLQWSFPHQIPSLCADCPTDEMRKSGLDATLTIHPLECGDEAAQHKRQRTIREVRKERNKLKLGRCRLFTN